MSWGYTNEQDRQKSLQGAHIGGETGDKPDGKGELRVG